MNLLATIALIFTVAIAAPDARACDGTPCGDSDGSCSVTVVDASRQLRKAIGLDSDIALGRDDTTGNGYVTVLDALHTLRWVAGVADFSYTFPICPREMVVKTTTSEAWHALVFSVEAKGLVPWNRRDTRFREMTCRTGFDDVYFEYGIGGPYDIFQVALVVPGAEPIFGPADTELIYCLVYPTGDDGDEAWFPYLDEDLTQAYFWPEEGEPVQVPLGLVAYTQPALWPGW